MGSFNKFIFFFYQNSISDFDMMATLIKKPVWEDISNWCSKKECGNWCLSKHHWIFVFLLGD
jgi:hypothetical protein